MIQFYFLSVLLNILVGMILLGEDDSADDGDEEKRGFGRVASALGNDNILSNETFSLVAGVISVFVGLIKLFFTYSSTGKNLFIIGDFFPALTGLAGGLVIVLEYYASAVSENSLPDFVGDVLFANKRYIGIICILAAVLHFALPGFVVF